MPAFSRPLWGSISSSQGPPWERKGMKLLLHVGTKNHLKRTKTRGKEDLPTCFPKQELGNESKVEPGAAQLNNLALFVVKKFFSVKKSVGQFRPGRFVFHQIIAL